MNDGDPHPFLAAFPPAVQPVLAQRLPERFDNACERLERAIAARDNVKANGAIKAATAGVLDLQLYLPSVAQRARFAALLWRAVQAPFSTYANESKWMGHLAKILVKVAPPPPSPAAATDGETHTTQQARSGLPAWAVPTWTALYAKLCAQHAALPCHAPVWASLSPENAHYSALLRLIVAARWHWPDADSSVRSTLPNGCLRPRHHSRSK